MSNTYPQFGSTSFPDTLQTIEPFADVAPSDAPILSSFYNAILAGDRETASKIFATIPNGTQKILSARRFNIMGDTILSAEQFFTDGIEPMIAQKQAEWLALINEFSYIGVYNPSTKYDKNNLVSYTLNGLNQMYICHTPPPAGTVPNDTRYWRVFTIRGAKGDAGKGANFDYTWDSGTAYTVDTIVVWNNAWWICTTVNQSQEPFEGSNYWSLVLTTTQALYPFKPTEPTGQTVGELWFRTFEGEAFP